MVNYDLIKEMFKLQDEFNEYTVKDWKNANLAWHRAIWLECAEAVDSTPWKWWKKGELDENNLKVELVDIWHFLMSYAMVHFPDLAKNPENYHNLFELEGTPNVDIVVMIEDLAGLVLEKPNDEQIYTIFIFINAWNKLGYSVNDLYREYVIKNVLNKFRQDNGYKTGEYKKMWTGTDGKSYEDNVIVWEVAETVELNEHMFDNLYSKLNYFYTNMN